MPNWCEAKIDVCLPTKNVDKFLKCFIGSEQYNVKENKEELDFFYRTFYEEHQKINEEGEYTTLAIYCHCAWSCEGCLEFGKNPFNKDEECCLTLSEVCKDLDVKWLHGESDEPGMCFGEIFDYDKTDERIAWEVFDTMNYLCDDCDMFFTARDIKEAECPCCGKLIKPYNEEESNENKQEDEGQEQGD